MKRSMFALFAALTLLLAAPVLAQEGTVEEPQPFAERTNPDARSIAGDSGLTLSGTVVEWNDEQLTLRTTTGVEHIQIVPDTDKPTNFTAGETVTVDYTRTSQGVMIAQEIRAEGETATTPHGEMHGEMETESRLDTTDTTTRESMDTDVRAQADVDTSLDTDTTRNQDFDADANVDTQADFETDVDTDLDTRAEADFDTQADLDTTMDDDTLPATGSELPLVALLGLLSVAAAVGVRSYIR